MPVSSWLDLWKIGKLLSYEFALAFDGLDSMRPHIPRLLVLAAAIIVAPSHADEKDPIRAELDKAKQMHQDVSGKAKASLLVSFDETSKAVAQLGDLDGVKAIQAERKAFMESGKLPTSAKLGAAVGEYSQAIRQAKTTLDKAFDQAVKSYTKGLKIEQAEAVRNEWKDAETNTKPVETEPLPPAGPRLSQLMKDRAALTAKLADTTWTWGADGKERVMLKADGTVTQQSSKLVGTWVAVTGNRVIISWQLEPTNYDLLVFDAALSSVNAVHIGGPSEKSGHIGKVIRK